ncbi:prephenate dehydrogenase [uncultured Ruthenibacterium sp.]|uniref:prephenate dehydrogenase n=1 Tax=uncultured Ruthenibacterium sp. TaxID=1905347 RepID=UPI00349E729C
MKERNFCIVGLGLLGGSYARGLTEAGCRVTAVDVRKEAIRFALEKGWIAAGAVEDFGPLVSEAEAVVLALYPHALIDWVQANGHLLRPGTLVTDVCGVKQAVVDTVQKAMPEGVEFIASHPMAGKEVSGVEYADCAIFRPANFILTPTEKNTPRGVEFARQLAETLGFAHIAQLSCAEHDRMIGYVSQLTHAIAVSLMNANGDPRLCEFTGDSFRDLTRIARINENLWSELFLLNRDALCAEIDQFQASLTDLKEKLLAGDEEGLKELFCKSTQRRAMFDR